MLTRITQSLIVTDMHEDFKRLDIPETKANQIDYLVAMREALLSQYKQTRRVRRHVRAITIQLEAMSKNA